MNWLNEILQNDPGPQESREWIESLKAFIGHDGAGCARQSPEGKIEPVGPRRMVNMSAITAMALQIRPSQQQGVMRAC